MKKITIEDFIANPKESRYSLKKEWNIDFHQSMLSAWPQLFENHIVFYLEVLKETNLPTYRGRLRLMKTSEILEVVEKYLESRDTQDILNRKLIIGVGLLAALALCDADKVKNYFALYQEIPLPKHGHSCISVDLDIKKMDTELKDYQSGKFMQAATELRERLSNKFTILKGKEIATLAKMEVKRKADDVFLHNRKTGSAWLIDANYQLFYFDGLAFTEPPLHALTWVADEKQFFDGLLKCDEERLYWSGKNIYFSLQRYNHRILCTRGKYFADRGETLMLYSIWFVASSSVAASKYLSEICSSLPSSFKSGDNFFSVDENQPYAILRSYTSLDNQFDTTIQGVWKNHWIDDDSIIKSFKATEDAIAAFQKWEMEQIKTERFITGFSKISDLQKLESFLD